MSKSLDPRGVFPIFLKPYLSRKAIAVGKSVLDRRPPFASL